MKIVEVANQFGLDIKKFNEFLCTQVPKGFSLGFLENTFDRDADLNEIVLAFKQYESDKANETPRMTSEVSESAEAIAYKAEVSKNPNTDNYLLWKIEANTAKIEGHVRFLKNVVIVALIIFGVWTIISVFSFLLT